MKPNRNWILWIVVALVIVGLFSQMQGPGPRSAQSQVAFSDFLHNVESGQVTSVTIRGQDIQGRMADGSAFQSFAPADADFVARLADKGVKVTAAPPPQPNPLVSLLISSLPMLLLIGVWIYFMRRMQGGSSGLFGFGKSRARLMSRDARRVTFQDVAGIDEAKQELEEIVEFLRGPDKFQRLGGQIPRGVLLVGPPGTGKTLLARAIAGEANVPYFSISGSDFVEMFVGVGASRVRDMFEQAKRNAPCIVFIDEIDAVGRKRGAGLGGGHDEREQTLNQLLVEMDGFEPNLGVIIIAATNRPDVLDPALMRPGRFDRQVVVANPDILGREQILKVHMRKVPVAPDVEPRVIARGTPGFSGADLANLVNEAALLAARAGKRLVSMAEFEGAKDKILMGTERRSMVMTEHEKRITAYHEAGHALVGLLVPGNDPLHKVTIIPRGRALGVTMNLPERDRYAYRKAELAGRLAMMFGGRVAEQLTFGAEEVTTGAANDIQQATQLARRMVTEWGMSELLGRLRYVEDDDEIFLGRAITRAHHVSEDTARQIDDEVRRLVEEAEGAARKTLMDYHQALGRVAEALLEYETLNGDEVRILVDGGTIERRDIEEQSPNPPTAPSGEGSPNPKRRRSRGSVPGLQPQN